MGQNSALLNEARESLNSGDWDQAIGQLESLKNEDDSAEVFENLAKAFALRGRYLSVLSIYLEWGHCELRRGELERAEAALGYAQRLNPASHEVHRLRVDITRARGNSERLVSELCELAFLALEQGEGDSSADYMREAMEVAPENTELSVQLAELYVSLGQIPGAVKEYRKAINRFKEAGRLKESLRPLRGLKLLSSDDLPLLLELGDTCLQLGAVDEAEEQYRAVLKLDLENREALLKLGQVCHRKGLFRNGILALSKVIQLEPECAEAHSWLGEIVAVSKEPASALEHFHRAAALYLETGRPEEAGRTYQRLLEFEADDAEALNGLMSLGMDLKASRKPTSEVAEEVEEPVEMPVAEAVSSTPELPEERPVETLTESAEATIAGKRFSRPAMVRKTEFAKPTAGSSKKKSGRLGLVARDQEPSQGKFSGKKFLNKPMFPTPVEPAVEDVPEPEPVFEATKVEPVMLEPVPEPQASVEEASELPATLDDLPSLEDIFAVEESYFPEEPIGATNVTEEAVVESVVEDVEKSLDEAPAENPIRILEPAENSLPDIFEGWDILDDGPAETGEVDPEAGEPLVEAGWAIWDLEEIGEEPSDIEPATEPEPVLDFDEILRCEDLPLAALPEAGPDQSADDDFPLTWDDLWTNPADEVVETVSEDVMEDLIAEVAQELVPEVAQEESLEQHLEAESDAPEIGDSLDDIFQDFAPLDLGSTWLDEVEEGSCEITAPLQDELEWNNEPVSALTEPEVEAPLAIDIPLPDSSTVAPQSEPEHEVQSSQLEDISMLLLSTLTGLEAPETREVESVDTLEPCEDQPLELPLPLPEEAAECDKLNQKEPVSECPPAEPVVSSLVEPETDDISGLSIDELRLRLLEYPTHEATLQRLGDLCLQFGLLKEALAHYRTLEKIQPGTVESTSRVVKAALWLEDHACVVEGLWRVAGLHFNQGRLEKCQDALGSLLALQPDHKPARQMLVDVFMACGQEKIAAWHLGQMADRWMVEQEYEHATLALERLIGITEDGYPRERLAKLYDFLGRQEQARDLYRELRHRYEAEERWEKAVEFAELLVASRDCPAADAEYLLSLYHRLGMTQKVLAEKRRLAESLRKQGEPRRAVELLQDVLSAHPGELATERLLVELYLESGELALAEPHADTMAERFLCEKSYKEATELFELWVRVAPTSTRVRERLAQFYQLHGDLDGAKLEWLLVSEGHLEQGDFERAARSLERALELAPTEREWRLKLAVLKLEKLQDASAALQDFRTLFQLEPAWEQVAKPYLSLLLEQGSFDELGEALRVMAGHPGGAELEQWLLDSLHAELESKPNDLDLQQSLAELYFAKGSLDKAIELFQKLRRHKACELRAYRYLGRCFAQKSGFNMRELALSQYRKGLSLGAEGSQELEELRYDMASLLEQMGRRLEAFELWRQCSPGFRDVADRLKSQGEL